VSIMLRTFARAIVSDRLAIFGVFVLVIYLVLAIFAPVVAPYDPNDILTDPETGVTARFQPPSLQYLFGTNNLARDVFSQVVYGSRVALVVGFASAMSVTIIGSTVGLFAGYFGGRLDDFLMRTVDIAYSIPFEPFAILLVGLMGPSILNLVLAMTLLMWRAPARVIRSQVLSISQRPFVKAARVAGASDLRIIYLHIMPNILPVMLLYIPITVGWAIIAEASISFLGFGTPQMISWGGILQTAFTSGAMRLAWWWTLAPGMSIVLVVISVFFISRALEPIANPSLGKS
jgi:peptide/nickel transport system permease protein